MKKSIIPCFYIILAIVLIAFSGCSNENSHENVKKPEKPELTSIKIQGIKVMKLGVPSEDVNSVKAGSFTVITERNEFVIHNPDIKPQANGITKYAVSTNLFPEAFYTHTPALLENGNNL